MLKFFRRIRRRLLATQKLRRYLLYAIGEILLVVIGILIALQVNNWNEANRERATGNDYLERIRVDMVKDTIQLNQKIRLAEREQSQYIKFIEVMYQEKSSLPELIDFVSMVTWDAGDLVIENNTYVEITNSGKLSMIKYEEIRNSLMDYYRRYMSIHAHISEMNQTGLRIMEGSYVDLVKYYESERFLFEKDGIVEVHDWAAYNNPQTSAFKELEAAAVYYRFKQQVFEQYYRELKAQAKKLIWDIDQVREG